MKPPVRDPNHVVPASDLQVDEPQALSLNTFSFNFTVDTAARIRGRMGAPAFALRRKRLDRKLAEFWRKVEDRHDALWIAAREGRIDDEGRELRPALLNSEGRDPFAHREHRKKLFAQRVDEDASQRRLFNLSWKSWVSRLDLTSIQNEIASYNKYFPIEANLATDPETGAFLWKGGPWRGAELLDQQLVFERFPLR
jgi:hypothetical protein